MTALRAFVLFAASQNDFHWFLTGTSLALFFWNGFEVFNLWKAVTVEGQKIWGPYTKGKVVTVSIDVAICDIVEHILGFYCVVNLFILFVGHDCLFEWFLLPNFLIAWGPGELWRNRQDRRGRSVGLAIVIVLATVNTFAPWSMWVLAMPDVFDTTWYHVSGVVFTAIAVQNLSAVLSLPAKKWEKGENRPI